MYVRVRMYVRTCVRAYVRLRTCVCVRARTYAHVRTLLLLPPQTLALVSVGHDLRVMPTKPSQSRVPPRLKPEVAVWDVVYLW